MRKLLIVDDEHHIVDWLYELFMLESKLELDIYKAYSADEALGWLERTKIDIVLSDIKMPGMSGLELLEKVYADWPFCKVIFLTGYNQFEYIYEANKYPGVIYLLKTEDDDVIIKAVKKQIESIESDLNNVELLNEMNEKNDIFVQSAFILGIINEQTNIKDIAQADLDRLKIPIDIGKPLILLMGKINGRFNPGYYMNIYYVSSMMKKYLGHMVRFTQCDMHNGELLWLFQPYGNIIGGYQADTNKYILNIKASLEDIQYSCGELLKIGISFIISTSHTFFPDSLEKIRNIREISRYRLTGRSNVILTDSAFAEIIAEESRTADKYSDKKFNSVHEMDVLETYLLQGQREQFFSKLEIVLEQFGGIKSMHYPPAIENYYSLSLILFKYINRLGLNEEMAFKTGIYKLTKIDEFESWEEAREYLVNISDLIFDMQKNLEDDIKFKLVGKIQNFVYNNISGDLSLINIAENLNYNPSYVSRMFKKLTGSNITEFINSVRLGEAKKMLEQGNMNINEIARTVGFESSQYFATVFKKYMNHTPKEYSDRFLQSKKSKQK